VKEEAMLTIRSVDLTEVVPDDLDVTPKEWLAYCRERGLVALAAEWDEEPVGFAVAESRPRSVHILKLEGDTRTCLLLLDRLTMLAGERNVGVWVPIDRLDVRRMLKRLGFARRAGGEREDGPAYFYHWNRNADV
jgi:hypothetical protein